MYAPPDDATRARMAAALAEGARRLGVMPSGPLSWGWQGCTIGSPAGDRWLRIDSSTPGGTLRRAPGEGAAGAEQLLPAAVPRPRLHGTAAWVSGGYTYEAELSDLVTVPVISPGRCDLTTDPGLPEHWWTNLRQALGLLAASEAGMRITVRDTWAARAFPHYLGIPAPDTIERTTGHGDLQWANITGPPLTLLDWERWGRVPVGFDAGLLHACSLAVPAVADRIRSLFDDVLDTEAGRIGELCALAEMLQAVARGWYPELAEPLTTRAQQLTGTRPPESP
ncbi:hypothetical protein GO001_34390 [Streptomyces sp. NRRL B-1677]|uniref:Aminoglycoside phosphotransferase n=1 Tax=Streptomyces klenkii TaxID=1420899 RepID=A0A3B0AFY2_9ACTN|nr:MULTISPECIES: hypothetical protein [Streptomyces]MBF6050206.1 hypothetical protein [Streptomyces sp. NRRL B-1677]RKN59655.1 hypothetical protein D7231_34125 [Streptomyces klenkii]